MPFGSVLFAYFAWFAVENCFPMIPREILKKSRRLKICMNRIVTKKFAGALSTKARVLTAKYAKYTKGENALWFCFVRVFRVVRGSTFLGSSCSSFSK